MTLQFENVAISYDLKGGLWLLRNFTYQSFYQTFTYFYQPSPL